MEQGSGLLHSITKDTAVITTVLQQEKQSPHCTPYSTTRAVIYDPSTTPVRKVCLSKCMLNA